MTFFADVSTELLVRTGMPKVVHFILDRGRDLGTTSAETLGHCGFVPFALSIGITATSLLALKDYWLAIASEIQQGRCNIHRLTLCGHEISTEAIKALASAVQLDRNLEHITIQIEDDFTDEAGVALAETLTVNRTLRKFTLSEFYNYHAGYTAILGAPPTRH